MCGIVGYIGGREAVNVLLNGLRRLEYRGYDSAGIAVVIDGRLETHKAVGKVHNLASLVAGEHDALAKATIGIAHTRWATHGPPSVANAHPHLGGAGRIACVHNGIIENHAALRERLRRQGHAFVSETDTEVLPHLIEELYDDDLLAAVAAALRLVEGTFGIAVIDARQPDRMVVARRGSPIVLGIGHGETIAASDVSAIVGHTNKVIYLEDNDIALVTRDGVDLRTLANVPVTREVTEVDWDVSQVEKGGYDHFMLKEIHEQPEALLNSIRGRLDHELGTAILSGLSMSPHELADVQRLVYTACGTSMHAAMVGEYYMEDLANLLTDVEQAAEFRYRNPILDARTMVMAISQSGETADTLAALREAKLKGSQVAAICNVIGSTIAREAGRGVYLHAGPEIGVASTKAFTCQVTVLLMLALKVGRTGRLTRQAGAEIVADIARLPEYAAEVLKQAPAIELIARKWATSDDWFFIGRGCLYPVALEGALKLKEISYIHAEGYHAAELKHGPIALLDKQTPVVALANDIDGKDKIQGNIQECKARHAPVILTVTEGDHELDGVSDDVIVIPRSHPYLTPVTTAIALQLLAYYAARDRGCDIDTPRNLAKSVTVE